MAEIHIEKKRGIAPWVWLLLLALIIIAAVVYFWQTGYINLGGGSIDDTTLASLNFGGINGA